MKLTTLFFTVALLTASAAGYSQITLKEKNVPLEKALSDIEKQTKYVFLYDAGDLKSAPVTVDVTNVTLEEALKQCLAGLNIEFTVEDHNVLLRSKPATAIPPATKKEASLIDVHGRVVDVNGLPLPAATVQIKNGKQQVTITDEKGLFTLTGVESNAVVVITMIGYEKRELPVAANLGDIQLKVASSQLDAVQVIAYGTTTQRLNTGDVSSVSAKTIEEQPVDNPLLALEGQVPGLYVQQGSGIPGNAMIVQIRGINSLTEDPDPLYIIDGVPYSSGNFQVNSGVVPSIADVSPFSFLDPADIASIDILKDAAATAIYGSRGANGVILITTKKGKAGEMKIDLTMRSGFGEVAHEVPLLNTQQYLAMRHQAINNDGGGVPNSNTDYDLTLWDTTRYTDWQKVLLGGKARYDDASLSISGGNANTSYLIGAGYHRQTTVTPGDFNDQKGSLNFNINSASTNQKFKIALSGNYSIDENDIPSLNFVYFALDLPPDAPPLYKSDGTINWAPNASGYSTWPQGFGNPAADMLNQVKITTDNVLVNSTISYEVVPGLFVKSDMGIGYTLVNQFSDLPFAAIDPALWPTSTRTSWFDNDRRQSLIIEPQVAYKKALSKGVLNFLAGTTINQVRASTQPIIATGFSNDLLLQDIAAATLITSLNPVSTIYKYNAVFGRLDYNWQDKYILNLTTRRDGSSNFGPDNRFHDFWDIGAAWIFSEESWVKSHLPWLSFGKLNGSYGTTGNDGAGSYSYLDLYSAPSASNVLPYQGSEGLTPTNLYNPNLQWELTRKLEGSINLGFLKDRILVKVSYYRNRSSNELLPYNLPLITGFASVETNLNALVQNKGWEWQLSTINIISGKFRWSSSFNLSVNRNELLSAGPEVSATYQRLVGHSLFGQWLYHFVDVNPLTGLAEFASSQGGKTSTPNPTTDQTVYEDEQPKFYGGVQNSISYKMIQLDFNFQFVKKNGGAYLFNGDSGMFLFGNQPATVLAAWKQPGDVTNIERLTEVGLGTQINALDHSDMAIGDASFVRLKNVSLSYSLSQTLVKKAGLRQASLFIQGQNLLTISKYKGPDPETAELVVGSARNYALPPLRVWTIGLKVGL